MATIMATRKPPVAGFVYAAIPTGERDVYNRFGLTAQEYQQLKPTFDQHYQRCNPNREMYKSVAGRLNLKKHGEDIYNQIH